MLYLQKLQVRVIELEYLSLQGFQLESTRTPATKTQPSATLLKSIRSTRKKSHLNQDQSRVKLALGGGSGFLVFVEIDATMQYNPSLYKNACVVLQRHFLNCSVLGTFGSCTAWHLKELWTVCVLVLYSGLPFMVKHASR